MRNDTEHESSGSNERLRNLADRFGQAWQGAGVAAASVDLTGFLPAAGDPLRAEALRELIRIDLEMRWRHGQPVALERYVEKFPELGAIHNLPPQLIFEEYCVRERYGDKPPLDAYRSRFPGQFDTLRNLVRQHPMTAVPTTPPGSSSSSQAAPPRDSDQILQVGGGYKLIRCIGNGSYAQVWKAEAPGGIEVAVKIIKWRIGHKASQQELHALELMKRLRHTFLLPVQAYWPLEDRIVIVTELADRSLRDRLEQCQDAGLSGIPIQELLTYIRESAEALDFLHAQSVLHRDVKPENILLLQGHAKVADFGLARFLPAEQSVITATVSGTPTFMAPEVWHNQVGPQSDQYSLALTYAELRLGEHPFPGQNMVEIMKDHMEHAPDLSRLPEAEQRPLLRALSKQSRDRYATCTEFVQDLERAVRPPDETRPIEAPAPAVPPTSRAAVFWIAAALVLSLIAVAGAVWWQGRPKPWLPREYEKLDGATVHTVAGKQYYDRIARVLPDGTRVVFLLVPQQRPTDPATFYIMQDKVWNGLFGQFAAEQPSDVAESQWRLGARAGAADMTNANPQLPVMRLTAHEALQFAQWLDEERGLLPTVEQWDKAAGCYGDGRGAGPFQEPWSSGEIAIDREDEGPMEVGSAIKDVSPFGCRDMAGNGREWTRTIYDVTGRRRWIPQDLAGPEDLITLRGRSYAKQEPLTCSTLELEPDAAEAREPRWDIGFRVIVQP